MFTTITDKNRNVTLFGFSDYDDMCGEFVLINKEYLVAYEDYDKLLDVGEILLTSKIIKIKGGNNILDVFASKIYNYPHTNLKIPSGWCSWYANDIDINENKILSNIDRIHKTKIPIKYIQIDDGYMKNIGDWLQYDDKKFPNGLSTIVNTIKTKNYKAGIWVSPFLVSKTSNIMKKYPEWILKDEYGKMVFATFNDKWNGNYTYSLDLSHPGVKQYIFDVFKNLKKQGFEYFKLDFL
jgi:alpha-galactosidase